MSRPSLRFLGFYGSVAAASAVFTLGAAQADVPRVAVDIAPVHALAAQVMAGVGVPDLVLPPGASPHSYALRPSEATALARADLVIWIGADLTPSLARAIDQLSQGASRLTLLEVPGAVLRETRTGASFESHDHSDDHGHDDHDEHDHDEHDHDEHDHGGHEHDEHEHDEHEHDEHEHEAHDDHGHDDHGHDHDEHAHEEEHDHEEEHGHDEDAHGGLDPHAWLDPVNAQLWLGAIAEALVEQDPENAAIYRAHAAQAQAELDGVIADLTTRMTALGDVGFIVFHDAYQYFEARFGLSAAGAISLSDATPPSPARVAEINALVNDLGINCIFAEPQFNNGLVDAVFSGETVALGVIDPLGAQVTPGPGAYVAVLNGMAESFEACE